MRPSGPAAAASPERAVGRPATSVQVLVVGSYTSTSPLSWPPESTPPRAETRPSGPVAAARSLRAVGRLAVVDQVFVAGSYASTSPLTWPLESTPPMA